VRPTGRAMGALAQNEAYSFLSMAGLYAINFLAVAMGALLRPTRWRARSTPDHPGDRDEARTAREVVLGKWLGFAGCSACTCC